MRWTNVLALGTLFGTLALGADEKGRDFKFDKASIGTVPPGWTVARTGKGQGSDWKVVADETAPSRSGCALAQVADSPSALFNLCVVNDTRYKDLEASVAFKAIRGKNDQGGGIVWRYQDADNYYIARMNPLEDNYRVYKVVAGKRLQLGTKEGVTAKAGEWHTLKIEMKGDHIQCSLDGKTLLDVHDDTFKAAGKVGLWSKADAQTHFDEFKVRGT
jgi:3-keto-disaccharide hydrolase